MQLGTWDKQKNRFDKYGWVPTINTPIHLYTNSITPDIKEEYYEIGKISESNLPVLMNVNTAISHHMAVLGVTGTGKSCFVRNLIKEYHKDKNRKIFLVDITGEHKGKLSDSRILFSEEEINSIYDSFKDINIAKDRNYNKDTDDTRKKTDEIKKIILHKIKSVILETDQIDIIDLPNVDNNQNMIRSSELHFLGKNHEIQNKAERLGFCCVPKLKSVFGHFG